MSPVPPCRPVRVVTFQGDRSKSAKASFDALLEAEKAGLPGPSREQCLFHAGHTGVSLDGGMTIHSFNPDGGGLPAWQVLDELRNGKSYPGIVLDDTAVFTDAKAGGLFVLEFNVVLPEPVFRGFEAALASEQGRSRFRYGFPNGDGDCNCTTWPERLWLPLLTGRMDEFVAMRGIRAYPSRRFGEYA